MKELNLKKCKSLYAGGISAGLFALLASGVSFVIGVLDGITRPFRCR